MAKNLIDNSKKYLNYFYNCSNGEWVKDSDFRFNGHQVSVESKEFLSNFFHFLIESTFLNDCSLLWLKSNLNSMRAAIEAYNEQVDEIDALSTHTAINNIDYDKKRLARHFDENILDNVLAYPEKYLEAASLTLDSMQRQYMKDKIYNQSLVIKIPKKYITRELNDYAFVQLTNMLEMYSRKKVRQIEEGTDPVYNTELFGYYNYLISSKNLSDNEKIRLSQIKSILGIS